MNLKKIINLFLLTVFFSIPAGLCYGQPWKELHQQADKISLQQALADAQIKPDSEDELYVLELVYLALHKDKEAEKIVDKMLILNPSSVNAKWAKAELIRRQHNLNEAERLLNEIIQSIPEFFPAYLTLAYIKFTKFEFEAAIRLASFVLGQGKDKVDISNYVRAHLMVGGAKGMIAHYGGPVSKLINGTAVYPNLKKAEQLQPHTAGVKFGLGAFYLLAPSLVGGDLAKAEKYLKEAIEADPLFPDAYVRLGQLYKLKGEREKYQEYLFKALELDPLNELALDIRDGICKCICLDKKE